MIDDTPHSRSCCSLDKERNSGMLGLVIYEVSREWRKLIDARLRDRAMSASRWQVLKTLDLIGHPASQKEIADFIGIGGPTLVRSLDGLERDGWVRRRLSERDRRVKLVELRPKATRLLEEITQVCLGIQEEVLAPLQEQEIETCRTTLLRVRDRLQQLNA
ncbi:MAG: MarR family winged helix-turn-helix transcriptional regulator [Desulfovibrionaceae bacterium]